MNLHETETQIQLALSVVIMFCVLVGTFVIFSMARRENELILHVKSLSILNDQQAKVAEENAKVAAQTSKIVEQQAESYRVQGEVNRNLTDEIADIRKRQDILRRVAERIGIDANAGHKDKTPKP